MENPEMTTEDRLKNINAERKVLREQVAKERAERLANASAVRDKRDAETNRVLNVLDDIKKEIFAFNKSGKVLKAQNPILETIAKIVSHKEPQMIEDMESEDEIETSSY